MTTNAAVPTAIYGPAYQEAVKHGMTGFECIVCGKQTRRTGKIALVRVGQSQPGGLAPVQIDADIREEDDLGFFPVGPDCSKKFPNSYILLSVNE